MSQSFQKLTAKFIGTGLILFIAISFLFTGYEGTGGSSNNILSVGSHSVGLREYRNEFRRQLEFFKMRYMNGKDLNAAQIEQFGLKRNALSNIVSKLLMTNLSDSVGIHAAPLEIKKTIREFKAFQSGDQFDLNRYKLVLQQNELSPSDFEEEIANDTRLQSIQGMLRDVYISDKYKQEVVALKNKKIKSNVIIIKESDIEKSLKVNKQEINDYLAKAENIAKVEDTFNTRKDSLSQKAQVKARHILLRTDEKNVAAKKKEIEKISKKLTRSNFKKMAEKHTEDPSGKTKGGNLNWFGKGQMVPEFEKAAFALKKGQISKPVKTDFGYHIILLEDKKAEKIAKLEDHKLAIAEELLKASKTDEIKEKMVSLSNEIKELLVAKNFKKIKKLQTKNNFVFEEKISVNRFDGTSVYPTLSQENIAKLFNTSDSNIVEVSKAKENILLQNLGEDKKSKPVEPNNNLAFTVGSKMSQTILDDLRANTKIKYHVNPERL